MGSPHPRRALLRRPVVQLGLVVVAVLVAVALLVFEPWKLVVDQRVNEALPTVSAAASSVAPGAPDVDVPVVDVPANTDIPGSTGVPAATGTASTAAPTPVAPAEPVVLASGEFISHEHTSSGTVQILQLADGSRVLRLENLDTSNGPLLKVWLTDAPVIAGHDGWYVFDDGQVADLGELKGNIGSSNYPIPGDVDLSVLTSVSIWCDRFNVSFAAAALTAVP